MTKSNSKISLQNVTKNFVKMNRPKLSEIPKAKAIHNKLLPSISTSQTHLLTL